MKLARRVVSKSVPVALDPHLACVQGRQGFLWVEQRLVCHEDLHDVARWSPAVPLNFAPLL